MSTPTEINQQLMSLLNDATEMTLGMDNGNADYDLPFISSKLKSVSIYLERLSDIQMKLTKMNLSIRSMVTDLKDLLRMETEDLKASEEYRSLPTAERPILEREKLGEKQSSLQEWNSTADTLRHVAEAVENRLGMMKRLDSDLRLHAKIYEQMVASGATSPTSFTGASTEEIDIG